MREHEVPTHVQAEDRVLLWLTFPQIVAMTAVCALAYGVWRYAPLGPAEVRMALAVLFGLAGLAAVAGRIGGRRLPLVAADLLRFGLGARRYAGPPAELVRSERPAPVQPSERNADPLRLLVSRVRRAARRPHSKKRKEGERRNGRMPFRPHRLFGKRRRPVPEEPESGKRTNARENREQRLGSPLRRGRRGFWKTFLAAAAVALVVLTALPLAAAQAEGPGEGWISEEIEFRPPPLVPGRRLFVEGLSVSGEQAIVVLRAAADLDLRVRAYGGPEGRSPRYYALASLEGGERVAYDLPLDGSSPSLVFSWTDALGQAGAVSLDGGRLPWPLPAAQGELCDLRVVSLGWSAGAVEGVVQSECVSAVAETVVLKTVAGYADVSSAAVLGADVATIIGSVTVTSGGSETSVAFIAGGETRFRLPVEAGAAVHALSIKAELKAYLRIALPPLVELTHHPERTEYRTETVTVLRPGIDETLSETVAIPLTDGTFTEHTVSAHFFIPAEVVYQGVVLEVVHPERVEAELVERAPIGGSREESLALSASVWADDPYVALTLPDPEPEPEPVQQTPATEGELSGWFEALGWEWVW